MVDVDFIHLARATVARVHSGKAVREGDLLRLEWMTLELCDALQGRGFVVLPPERIDEAMRQRLNRRDE